MICSMCKNDYGSIVTAITDKNGTNHYCPNCLLSGVLNREIKFENNPDFIDDITGENGAVKFENDNETYVLEKATMYRLITHNLNPDEYFALAKKYGADKFEIHDDFYDEFDGIAIQPAGY